MIGLMMFWFVSVGSSAADNMVELWQSLRWTTRFGPMCWRNMVIGNNNSRLWHGHFTRTIDTKRINHTKFIHRRHKRRGQSHVFGIMLYATCYNHQLRFGRQSAHHFRRCHRIHIGSGWNCGHCSWCHFNHHHFGHYHRVNRLLLQKT